MGQVSPSSAIVDSGGVTLPGPVLRDDLCQTKARPVMARHQRMGHWRIRVNATDTA
jgi:hypothetical protein